MVFLMEPQEVIIQRRRGRKKKLEEAFKPPEERLHMKWTKIKYFANFLLGKEIIAAG